jgi:hypothetical protein
MNYAVVFYSSIYQKAIIIDRVGLFIAGNVVQKLHKEVVVHKTFASK